MSSAIRRSLGQHSVSRLQKQTQRITAFSQQPQPTTPSEIQDQLDLLEICRDDCKEIVVKIEKKAEEWQDLINGMEEDEARALEEAEAEKAANDPTNGYYTVIQTSEDQISNAELQIRRLKRSLEAAETTKPVPPSNSVPATPAKPSVKLPKLDLPRYNGDYLNWPAFWSIFKANVHDKDLSGTEKFSYLLSLLDGKAKDTIDGILVTDTNYDHAVGLLKQRFERPAQEQITTLYAQLVKLPVAARKIEDQRKTYDSCEKLLRQLETAGEDLSTNSSLVTNVLSKFPPSTVMYLQQHYKCGVRSDLPTLRKTLLQYLTEYEAIYETINTFKQVNEPPSDKRGSDGGDHKSSADQKGGQKQSGGLWPKFRGGFSGPPRPPNAGFSGPPRPPNAGFSGPPRPPNAGQNDRHFGKSDFGSTALGSFDSQTPPSPCIFCGGPHFHCECNKYSTAKARSDILRAKRACLKCFHRGHETDRCAQPKRCYFCQEGGTHPSPLCPKTFPSEPQSSGNRSQAFGSKGNQNNRSDNKSSGTANKEQGSPDVQMLNSSGNERSLLLTAVTTVVNLDNNRQIKARLIFDTASHRSYVLQSLSEQLELQTQAEEDLQIAIFGTKNKLSVASRAVELGIQLRDGAIKTIQAHTAPMITNNSLLPESLSTNDREFLRTMKYALADEFESENGTVQLLIGSDYFWEFLSGAKMTTPSGLFLIPSTVGLLLAGRYESNSSPDVKDGSTFLCITESTTKYPNELGLIASSPGFEAKQRDVDDFWDLETIGISDSPNTIDDEKAQKIFDDTIQFDEAEGRYQMSWPWKEGMRDKLPSNYSLAFGRFKSLHKRLTHDKDDQLKSAYQKTIDYQLTKGIIERVPDEQITNPIGPMHYLPHHPVIKAGSATTKVRIVYDASSKTRKDSAALNECLYRGPVILPDLCEILIRLRTHEIALIADIEKAFLQLGLHPQDREATRFLWYDDPSQPKVENNLTTFRFRRVAFGVISSPFLLGATIQHHLRACSSPIAEKIAKDVYVDNVVTGVDTLREAKTLYRESKQIFENAGMNLQEWCSNSDQLLQTIPEHDKVNSRKTKVLGLTWDSSKDTLTLSITNWHRYANCETKRQILCATASLFDPLGFFQPAILPAKRFLQNLWLHSYGWDDPIGEPEKIKWKEIHSSILPILKHEIPRRVQSPNRTFSIVAFCDASTIAYATAVYLIETNGENRAANLLFAKSRLAPTKSPHMTLPRLELLGIVIGAKAANFVRQSLIAEPNRVIVHLLTDSEIAIHWIRSTKPLSVFVENQVKKIRALENYELHHVRSGDNPADMATRGQSGTDLLKNQLWWHGPPWIRDKQENWPQGNFSEDFGQEPELKSSPIYHTMLAGEPSNPDSEDQDPNQDACLMGLRPSRYSSFRKLIRHSAILLKFLKWRVWNRMPDDVRRNSPLKAVFDRISDEPRVTADDINAARIRCVKIVQHKFCQDILEAIAKTKGHPLVAKLGLGCDDQGIIRSYSRLDNASIPISAKYPALLPSKGRFTDLIVAETHRRLFHAGVAHTLSAIRQEFWIHQPRRKINSVIAKCPVCKKLKGPPFALPKMPPWPKERVERSLPFEFTGLDYLGPVNVLIGDDTRKIWVCLFTCLAIRAVHLEWVLDCSAQEFLNCLIRFISRRGLPKQIVCDNAAQFRISSTLADRMWSQAITDDSVQSYAADQGIRWTFIAEFAPWQGGVYERLVGVVKTCMKAVVGRRLLSWSDFVTILAETEAIVNSRPITYVYGDINSRPVTLRPIDFLMDLPTNPGLPIDSEEPIFKRDLGDAGKRLAAYWFQKRKRLQKLWQTWYDEYLLSMRETGSAAHRKPRSEVRDRPRINEVVLVKDQDIPRGAWKLGRVMRLIESNDGEVRSAEVILGNDLTIRRSVKHLYPLECHQFEEIDNINPNTSTAPPVSTIDAGDESDDFHGFTDDDILRTINALRQFGDSEDEGSSSDLESTQSQQ